MSLLLAKAMGPTHMLCVSLVPTKEMIMSCPLKDIIIFCGHFCSYFWPWLGLLSVHSNLFSLYSESELQKWSARFWSLCSKYYFKYQRVMFCCCSPLFLQLKTLSKVNSNGPLSSLTIFKRPGGWQLKTATVTKIYWMLPLWQPLLLTLFNVLSNLFVVTSHWKKILILGILYREVTEEIRLDPWTWRVAVCPQSVHLTSGLQVLHVKYNRDGGREACFEKQAK